ncbi:MAG: hypothetical protein MUC87_16065 [Bacteroidia bacterium]|jgi:hypothetical protein|nr:hypothetical protein [Bacteroidia bacterium]
MSNLPARYAMGSFTIVFFESYKKLGIYSFSQQKVIAVHSLVNGRKISIDTSTDEFVMEAAPSTSLFKTTYQMDTCGGTIALTDCSIVVGATDGRGISMKDVTYPLTNSETCPNVVIKYDSANTICIYTACGDQSCSIVNSACKYSQDVTSTSATFYE